MAVNIVKFENRVAKEITERKQSEGMQLTKSVIPESFLLSFASGGVIYLFSVRLCQLTRHLGHKTILEEELSEIKLQKVFSALQILLWLSFVPLANRAVSQLLNILQMP